METITFTINDDIRRALGEDNLLAIDQLRRA